MFGLLLDNLRYYIREFKLVMILDDIFLVFEDDFCDFFYFVAHHFAEVVLDFEFVGPILIQHGKIDCILV